MRRENISVTPEQVSIIQSIQSEIKDEFMVEGTGHDWWHTQRVLNLSRRIAKAEGQPVNMFVIDLAVLLHDVDDWKFHTGEDVLGQNRAREIMQRHKVGQEVIDQVTGIIEKISFKGAGVDTRIESMEGKIVQDADRLDALGAIGIARAFAYGGSKRNPVYDPRFKPTLHQTFAEYKKGSKSTINHFFEKLLLLRDRMNTRTARRIAERRHQFMEGFLRQFFSEWEGKR